MLEKLLHRLKAMDTGIKIALGLFLGSAVVLGLTGGDSASAGLRLQPALGAIQLSGRFE